MVARGLTDRNDQLLRASATAVAGFSAAVVFLIGIFLFIYAYPAIIFNGSAFLTSLIWNVGNQYGSGVEMRHGFVGSPGASFGALVFVYGTLATSALAMAVATPLAFLAAIAMRYRVPAQLRPLVNTLVELMAGVPSVVYGLWGIIVLVPWIGGVFGPFVTTHFAYVPFLGGSAGSGNGLFAASLVLAIMVFPIMAATMRDVIASTPADIFEASIALGSTTWEAVVRVVAPAARKGLFAAVVLALGRALGETMGVLMVGGGGINQLPGNVFGPVSTMAATIVSQLDSALTDSSGMAERALGEIALLLFIITLLVNVIGRAIMGGSDRRGRTAS
ncbi:MAG: phosphate ABC transporter permease subunit PstC [Vulcanimicrobiaceae bacterium]